MAWSKLWRGVAAAGAALAAPALAAEAWQAPQHKSGWPLMVSGSDTAEAQASLDQGPDLERGRSPAAELAEQRRLDAALAGLAPQRPGIVDAYVVSIAL